MTWAIATPLQQTNIRRWLTELAHLVADVTCSDRLTQPGPRRYPAHHEPFIEDARMAREVLRL
jgi:hypothetical protein